MIKVSYGDTSQSKTESHTCKAGLEFSPHELGLECLSVILRRCFDAVHSLGLFGIRRHFWKVLRPLFQILYHFFETWRGTSTVLVLLSVDILRYFSRVALVAMDC